MHWELGDAPGVHRRAGFGGGEAGSGPHGVLGPSGAFVGDEGAALRLPGLGASVPLRLPCVEAEVLWITVRPPSAPAQGPAPGLPLPEERTAVEAMLQGDFQVQKGRGRGF